MSLKVLIKIKNTEGLCSKVSHQSAYFGRKIIGFKGVFFEKITKFRSKIASVINKKTHIMNQSTKNYSLAKTVEDLRPM